MADEQGRPKTGRKRRTQTVKPPQQLGDAEINAMDSMFRGFGAWYRENYDEQGKLIARVPGLQPAVKEGE